jgi:ribonuclease HI
MELAAIYEAVKSLEDGRTVRIHSDSRLAVEALNRRWKAKKNRDLIEAIWALPKWPCVQLHWIRGHVGQRGNEMADQLAVAAARAEKRGLR